MITLAELKEIMPHAPNASEHVEPLNKAMEEFGISTTYEQSMFLAQIAHETGELQWLEELGSGRRYEGRADLGNTHPGDGPRFKGRGDFQLTGRANYSRYGSKLGVDLIANPGLAATPELGARIAGFFWSEHNLNFWADQQNVSQVTRTINGGFNGLSARTHYYTIARAILGRIQGSKPVEIRLALNGEPTSVGEEAFWRADHIYVPLRKLCEEAGWGILKAEKGIATVRTGDGANHQIPFIVEGKQGFVNAQDLFGLAVWDSDSHTLNIG